MAKITLYVHDKTYELLRRAKPDLNFSEIFRRALIVEFDRIFQDQNARKKAFADSMTEEELAEAAEQYRLSQARRLVESLSKQKTK